MIAEKESGQFVGAHLAYPLAEEVIDVFALAIREGLTVRQLKTGLYTYPTATSEVQYMLP